MSYKNELWKSFSSNRVIFPQLFFLCWTYFCQLHWEKRLSKLSVYALKKRMKLTNIVMLKLMFRFDQEQHFFTIRSSDILRHKCRWHREQHRRLIGRGRYAIFEGTVHSARQRKRQNETAHELARQKCTHQMRPLTDSQSKTNINKIYKYITTIGENRRRTFPTTNFIFDIFQIVTQRHAVLKPTWYETLRI